jgi:RNA polymerase sigma-70 factor (ECF subfamily)
MSQHPLSTQPAASVLVNLDDDGLLERMQADDAAAFRVLVERHIDRTYALALRMLRNVADAEDVAQEAMVKAWAHRADWRPGQAKFTTWLYRVVVNRSIDLQRGAGLDEVAEPVDERVDAVGQIHRREVYGRLEAALGLLPAQQRAALTLAYFEEMGNADIAEVLGTTISAVESLLKRGRQGLRDKLKRAEHEVRQLFSDR